MNFGTMILVLFLAIFHLSNSAHFTPDTRYSCIYHQPSEDENEMLCYDHYNRTEAFVDKNLDVPGSTTWWLHFLICAGLVLVAGMMSGLTMGLMSLDLMNLKILKKSGTPEERRYAKGIIPLVKRHHLLLVTLLLANAGAMEALPIFLEHLVDPYVAIICSVTLVLAFGEIIPQAICTRYGLAIGYYLRYPVWALIAISFVLAYPIGKLLDCVIGHEGVSFFRRAELSELVQRHGVRNKDPKGDSSSDEGQGPLLEDEVRIIRGALNMREKTCGSGIYTALEDVFALELNTVLDRETLTKISEKRHSRIPIYRKHPGHIIGIILTKRLIHISPEDNVKVSSLELTQIPRVTTETPLYNLLNQFQKGKSHMALVLDSQDNLTVKGVVTLEDVIEQLLESEIFDEFDIEKSHRNLEHIGKSTANINIGAHLGVQHHNAVTAHHTHSHNPQKVNFKNEETTPLLDPNTPKTKM